MPFLLQNASVPGGYGAALLQTLLSLAAVCVLAWVFLRWFSRQGLGAHSGQVRLLEKTSLDPRRTLYLIEVGERVLLLGSGERDTLSVLAEIDPGTLPTAPARPTAPRVPWRWSRESESDR